MANQSKIVQIRNEWFVDVSVVKGAWKNHKVCKTEDEAMKSIENLRRYWGTEFIGIERDAAFSQKTKRAIHV